jgi:hypothetical protein
MVYAYYIYCTYQYVDTGISLTKNLKNLYNWYKKTEEPVDNADVDWVLILENEKDKQVDKIDLNSLD